MIIGLDGSNAGVFIDAMTSLRPMLNRSPLNVDVPIEPVPEEMMAHFEYLLNNQKDMFEAEENVVNDFLRIYRDYVPRLIVGCLRNHNLAKSALDNNPNALWGAHLGFLSLVYEHGNRHIVWHEALHLLGAEDCYHLPDRGPTCKSDNCIMQYETNETNVGEWPFLCGKNIKRIRERVNKYWNYVEKA
jgi:hypothetical protein